MASAVPNLPHYQSNLPRRKGRGPGFQYLEGKPFFEESPDAITLNNLRNKDAATSLAVGGAQRRVLKNNDRVVLQFDAYFKESVDESPLENHRVRICRILFYTEDGSMQVSENKQENSGMPQGTFVNRHLIPKGDDAGTFYKLSDLQVGGFIVIYGRKFHVVDCNTSTREFLEDMYGEPVPCAMPFPADQYNESRAAFMARSTGGDPNVDHKIKKNDMKNFAEATLGRTVDNSKREGFLRHDRSVLRFDAQWDDRDSLYGDVQSFRLHYFLADDTLEVLANYSPNCGRDPFPLVLKRGVIPKDMQNPALGNYTWRDLVIGGEVMVYKRCLVLTDADAYTREYYMEHGVPLAEPLGTEEEEQQLRERVIPPHTGFGSEEDSLLSCTGSLMPSPPRKKRGQDIVLRFMAVLDSTAPEDVDREFIITYYGSDSTVSIREPPRRNSGIMGGTFLSRMKVKDKSEGADDVVMTMNNFYLGTTVVINGHRFIMMEADGPTHDIMEARPDAFPNSDANLVIGTFRDRFGSSSSEPGAADQLRQALQEYDARGKGVVTRADMERVLAELGSRDLCGQRVVTASRAVGGTHEEVPYAALLDALVKEEYDGYK